MSQSRLQCTYMIICMHIQLCMCMAAINVNKLIRHMMYVVISSATHYTACAYLQIMNAKKSVSFSNSQVVIDVVLGEFSSITSKWTLTVINKDGIITGTEDNHNTLHVPLNTIYSYLTQELVN